MEAPERIGAPVGAGRSAAWPRAVPVARALVQPWTWSVLCGVTLVAFAAANLAALVLGRQRAFGHALQLWARTVLALGACKLEVEREGSFSPGSVVVANHQGFGDVLVLAALLPVPVVFAARASLFRVPLLGSVLRAGGHLRVERGGRTSSRALVESAAAAAAAGRTVVFFPEGTRSRQAHIQALRAGAFHAAARAGRPLTPIVLSGTRHLWGPGTLCLLPSRVAAAVLAARPPGEAEVVPRSRAALRDEMVSKLRRLEHRTGPRV